ncbi:MAG: hypothetical protein Q9159_003640 [Coniocarpon cinnabarinum]
MSAPNVPQRPARSLHKDKSSDTPSDVPQVPPRPQRISASSKSRDREASARSPLNDAGFAPNGSIQNTPANNLTNEDLKRPPSVPSLPLVGQEGMEYASLTNPQVAAIQKAESTSLPKSPQETRNVASDLPLHAPKASASPMTQKTRVAAVTRTDSERASAAGIGKPKTDYVEPDTPMSRDEYRPPSAASTERPGSSQAQSMYEVEEGIPSFGATIPLYPNAGDVQAPTPAPGSAGLTPTDLSRPGTTDGRRRSALGFHGPPGSYGLHGHGQAPHDKFEKAWYEKHPEELAKEEENIHHAAAHDERPSMAMSSDKLNKLVHDTGRSASGFGTNPEMIGTPTEAIGYQASFEYAARSQTPQAAHHTRRRSSRPSSSSYAESPLKKTFSAQEYSDGADAVEREAEDEKVHVVPPTRPQGKYSGAGYDPPTENLGPSGGNTDERGGWINEQGEGVPILASDEIAKYPSTDWMQPAVSPALQATEDEYLSAADSDVQPSYRSHQRSRSKGHSRPSSVHSHSSLSRFNTHDEGFGTPLEEIEEYEPLFGEDEEDESKRAKASAAKRPKTLQQQHFPSQDIWEDTPDSLRLEATVATPEPTAPLGTGTDKKTTAVFEPPEAELERKAEFAEAERRSALKDPSKGLVKPKFSPGVQEELYHRPGLRQRFPSRDIWEDTPDSLRLETTVGDNEAVNVDARSPDSTQKPIIPARPNRSKAEHVSDAPSIPAKPQAKEPATIPDRSKPTIPHRPARSLNKETSDPSSLTKTTSAESTSSAEAMPAAVPKAKPAVPARPSGSSKFASIKAGFMSDLNSRLSKGPAPPPKPLQEEAQQEPEEKAPLGDARKGRARGPARRKPAVSPAPSSGQTTTTFGNLSIAEPRVTWSIDAASATALQVNTGLGHTTPQSTLPDVPQLVGDIPASSPLATNTAGEHLQPKAETQQISAGHLAHGPSVTMDARARRESAAATERLRELESDRIGFEGDVPDPIVDQPTGEPPSVQEGEGAPLSPQKSETKNNSMDVAPTEAGVPVEADAPLFDGASTLVDAMADDK